MNEVKDICDRLLDEPAPPMRDAADVLATARRSARRGRLAAAGSGLAVLAAVAVGAAVALPGAAPTGPSPATALGGERVAPTGSSPATALGGERAAPPAGAAPTELPPAQASAAHRRQVDRVLRRAVPAGYTAESDTNFSSDRTLQPPSLELPEGAEPRMVTSAYGRVRVLRAGREGQLMAMIVTDFRPTPTGDLCAPAIADRVNDAADTRCQVIEVDGVPIQVTTSHDEDQGEVIVAVRYLRAGFLMVSSAQGRPVVARETKLPPDAKRGRSGDPNAGRLPPLPAPALTEAQVAAIAADRAMLPLTPGA